VSLKDLIDKYPLVAIEVASIDRANSIAKLKSVALETDRPIDFWMANPTSDKIADDIFGRLKDLELNPSGIFVFENLFAILAVVTPLERELGYQAIAACFSALNTTARQCSLVLLESSQHGCIPPTLRQLIWDYRFALPTIAELQSLLAKHDIDLDRSPRLVNVLAGLTEEEIEIGIRANKNLTDLDLIADRLLEYKYSVLASYGLEFVGETTTKDIGGLDRVKTALKGVQYDFAPAARSLNLPLPRGWLLVGIPGTGKTYFAKTCAQRLGFPLINIGIDVAKAGGITKFKQLLNRIDACEPNIPYFDEFDKFFVGDNSTEFLGVILTWLNEKTSKTFVLGTLNRLENLPPEVTRAGRFDRVFYVGFPDPRERQQILQIHCARFDRRFEPTPAAPYGPLDRVDWVTIIEATDRYVGAELAQVAVEAAKHRYYQNVEDDSTERDIQITLPDLLHGKEIVKSLYDRCPEKVFAIENTAAAFTEPASTPQPSPFSLEAIDIYAVTKI
jgi:ATP-dependent 26S proteasome regulatory subunit